MEKTQSVLNIGVVGHVDHGKTTLTSKITGTWTNKHSDEIKQGISIKLGYADACFYKCKTCQGLQAYGATNKCHLCGGQRELIRKVSFVDAPGHETLMAVMLSGATLLNGAILVVAANEDCPQPRTVEHFSALKMHGIKNMVVAQNKIDLVTKEEAQENYKKIRKFLDDEGYSHVPIIPTSAHFDANIDALVYALITAIPVPESDTKSAPLKMRIVRSFDINKPGYPIEKIRGGVLGGAIMQGTLSEKQKVWLYPGINKPIEITIESLNSNGIPFKQVHAGGLIAVGTDLDPFYVAGDKMIGQLICDEKSKPLMGQELELKYTKIERLLDSNKDGIKLGENVVLIIGTAAHLGNIKKIKGDIVNISLKNVAVYYKNETIAISRLVSGRWRLSGYAQIR
ncbi:MAG TPA: translation initiation factor IF-2 subunit gamma [archaeon]|jgi:translation initiation factor 2 subunit 3|nr:translation initiation factor IF-2 subunit gamma [archaeon]HPV66441.1 translation initiation factor IF-2 subunit gamma [archaeon]